ncbi:hypothetical protein [Xanthomonas euvesicatoria]|uniref:hypothetical protein n=1 Tax=Xanthomonas euvesicatoria TaxID=456327 RepID=UPI001C47A833|nr:hypothetical protein [Xanthomonas euvesicatoria]MBV6790167.1 hypothetical protein [Xanthomonas campestris pv. clerodendri]MBV6862538.1 hypothetical protein [Xanthomonas campestris pv. blepharidis]
MIHAKRLPRPPDARAQVLSLLFATTAPVQARAGAAGNRHHTSLFHPVASALSTGLSIAAIGHFSWSFRGKIEAAYACNLGGTSMRHGVMPLTAGASIRRKVDSTDEPTPHLRKYRPISRAFVRPINLDNAPCRV